jgi:hypothetical protein
MSRGLAAVCLLISTACGIENELQQTATLEARTNGVTLSEDGLDGTAGMIGMTCTIDAMFGCPTVDIDLPTDHEKVADHFGGRTLGTSDEGLHTIEAGEYRQSLDVLTHNVRSAAWAYDGPMWLADGPSGCSLTLPGGATVPASDDACVEGARMSPDRVGALWVASNGVTQRISASGSQIIAQAGDLIAWDESMQRLYTANRGERELRALDEKGVVLWSVKASGPIRDIAARGDRGEALVRVDKGKLTVLERRDGADGTLLGRSRLGPEEGKITVSENGRTLALAQDQRVTFFRLATDPEDDEVVDDTPPNCITAGSGVSAD